MHKCLLASLLFFSFMTATVSRGAVSPSKPASNRTASAAVVINGHRLSETELNAFLQKHGLKIPAGRYWYDATSGAWGLEGGPVQGVTRAVIKVGAALRADASGGGNGQLTGVFINGREIHPQEYQWLVSMFGTVMKGRYWLNGEGYYGFEQGPVLGNLIAAAQRAGKGGGYQKKTAAGYIGGDGNTSYFFDPETGCSVIPGGGVSC